ncbi:MAG: amidohydrolase [Deltaproteobacteria bacterium]|nr:amidohydrolase [Deltaproteobacteria bacterium]
MAGSILISSDSHIIEPPDLWTERIDRGYRDRAPHVVREEKGDWWVMDGKHSMSFLGIQTGDRFEKASSELVIEAHFEDVRPAAYDPKRYVEENREDGVEASVIYPSEAMLLYSIPDSGLCSAAMRAYNDYIADFCSEDPLRLKGIALINVDDPKEAIAELERCRKKGLAGAMITVLPPADRGYDLPIYEPFWSAAEDLAMPISMHVATGRGVASVDTTQTSIKDVKPSAFYLQDHFVRKSIGEMIFAGVFERHPKLRIGSVEHEVSWAPFFLFQMDYTYTQRPVRGNWHRFADKSALPSDYFKRQCFMSFQEDAIGMRERETVGLGTLMWGSDYPHTESTFPRSREILERVLADVPQKDRQAITCDNVAKLYGFDLAALRA